jgi:hypothetical protein
MTIFENRTETLREKTPSVKANRRQEVARFGGGGAAAPPCVATATHPPVSNCGHTGIKKCRAQAAKNKGKQH